MRALVTGANGLLGRRVCAQLHARGHSVLAVGRGERRLEGDFPYSSSDLADPAQVEALVRGPSAGLDAIVHCAGMTDVDACERDPVGAYRSNVVATQHLALAARASNAHLVHLSTDYVFDGRDGPYAEDATPRPAGVYALTKHLSEEVVRVLAPRWTVARTAVVYDWPPAGRSNFGAWLVQALSTQTPVKLFADQWVSPSLARNVAEMLAEVVERALTGFWNLAGAEVVDRVTFGRALCEVFGFDPALIIASRMAEVPLVLPRPSRAGLLTARTARELSTKPMGVSESLRALHETYVTWRASAREGT